MPIARGPREGGAIGCGAYAKMWAVHGRRDRRHGGGIPGTGRGARPVPFHRGLWERQPMRRGILHIIKAQMTEAGKTHPLPLFFYDNRTACKNTRRRPGMRRRHVRQRARSAFDKQAKYPCADKYKKYMPGTHINASGNKREPKQKEIRHILAGIKNTHDNGRTRGYGPQRRKKYGTRHPRPATFLHIRHPLQAKSAHPCAGHKTVHPIPFLLMFSHSHFLCGRCETPAFFLPARGRCGRWASAQAYRDTPKFYEKGG